ncbi:sigma-70 family RNA polymerase sigma factor [Sporolactobacillus pectinivorans]|uniref:sigma-70 family RNA polymerase sigma factor n=1 Tax=Sporolactobacillus pectinivorans TaxID=1591408 RepID=UPI0012FD517A|nr:sigma-70 family RNA polymerase sigma factor [Sporolactobacillus pectinivorans]
MPFTDLFAVPAESPEIAFERLLRKYEPKIIKAVHSYYASYACHLRGAADRDDLMQIARIAFWDANLLFDPDKVDPGKHPENVFIAFADRTVKGRLSDYLRKLHRHKCRETLNPLNSAPEIPFIPQTPISKQLHALLASYLFLLSPRERLYLQLILFKDWETCQVAEFAHVSEHTVRSWKKSLRKKLLPLKDSLMKNQ